MEGVKGGFPGRWIPLSGVLLCWQWGGKEWIKDWEWDVGPFPELGRVESCQGVQEIRVGSWLIPGGHAAALELRIAPQKLSPGSAGPPGVEEAGVGSPKPVLQ